MSAKKIDQKSSNW
jgi:hypothetical protein